MTTTTTRPLPTIMYHINNRRLVETITRILNRGMVLTISKVKHVQGKTQVTIGRSSRAIARPGQTHEMTGYHRFMPSGDQLATGDAQWVARQFVEYVGFDLARQAVITWAADQPNVTLSWDRSITGPPTTRRHQMIEHTTTGHDLSNYGSEFRRQIEGAIGHLDRRPLFRAELLRLWRMHPGWSSEDLVATALYNTQETYDHDAYIEALRLEYGDADPSSCQDDEMTEREAAGCLIWKYRDDPYYGYHGFYPVCRCRICQPQEVSGEQHVG